MKINPFLVPIFIAGSILLMSSCANKRLVTQNNDDAVVISEEVEEPDFVERKTITGSYVSVQGVMDELSCYCFNSGYITDADGAKTAICFDPSDDVPSCDLITVSGYVTSKSIQSNGACPAGMMGFLKVDSYTVGPTDY